MDTFEYKPFEGSGIERAAVSAELIPLEAATFGPETFIEESEEFQQAEGIQVSLEAVTASMVAVVTSPAEVPLSASPEAATAGPLGEVIVVGGLPAGAAPESPPVEETDEAVPDDQKEWGGGFEGSRKGEGEIRSEAVILPDVPGEKPGRKDLPPGGGPAETTLPEGGEKTGFKEIPERLDVILPEAKEPLTGVGTRGNVDTGKGFGPEMPFDEPEIDMMPGMGSGSSGMPRVIGNMPMGGGQKGGGSGFFDSDMPESGGYSSSGGGLPMEGSGRGWVSEGTGGILVMDDDWVAWEEQSTKGKSQGDCDKKAVKWQETLDPSGDEVGLTCHTKRGDYYYVITPDSITKYRKSQEPEGDINPTPYTGGAAAHAPTTPEKDNDTGKVLPAADLGGLDAGTWRANPDDYDDSGRFYGGIFGSDGRYHPDSGGARPIDPKRKTEDDGEAADKAE
jgi:hypothetical protein